MEATQRLLHRCQQELKDHKANLCKTRRFHGQPFQNRGQNQYRVMHWNILADKLSGYTEALTKPDKVFACPPECLPWPYRRWRVLEEIATYDPDIITLVELDKGEDLMKDLSPLGYELIFSEKDFRNNDAEILTVRPNGSENQKRPLLDNMKDGAHRSVIEMPSYVPIKEKKKCNDGTGIFWKSSKFDIVDQEMMQTSIDKPGKPGTTLEQVYNVVAMKPKDGGTAFAICGLHLKSTKSQEGEDIRVAQMDEVMHLLNRRFIGEYPVIICADFNGSLVAMTDKEGKEIKPMAVNVAVEAGFTSVYGEVLGQDPLWTSWKTRAGKTFKYTIDYIMASNSFSPKAVLGLVPEEMVPEHHFPNFQSASDHLSLVCDIELESAPLISRSRALIGGGALAVIIVIVGVSFLF